MATLPFVILASKESKRLHLSGGVMFFPSDACLLTDFLLASQRKIMPFLLLVQLVRYLAENLHAVIGFWGGGKV